MNWGEIFRSEKSGEGYFLISPRLPAIFNCFSILLLPSGCPPVALAMLRPASQQCAKARGISRSWGILTRYKVVNCKGLRVARGLLM